MWTSSTFSRCRAGALVFVVLTAGCAAKSGKVNGKVTLSDGQPLPGGSITFIPEKGNPASGIIKEDGTYAVDAPTGICKIVIDNRSAGKSSSPIGAGGAPVPANVETTSGPNYKGGPGMPAGVAAKMGGGAAGPPKNEGGAEAIAKMMEGKQAPVSETTAIPGKVVPINPKYYSADSSGLTFTVKGGSQKFDIKLE